MQVVKCLEFFSHSKIHLFKVLSTFRILPSCMVRETTATKTLAPKNLRWLFQFLSWNTIITESIPVPLMAHKYHFLLSSRDRYYSKYNYSLFLARRNLPSKNKSGNKFINEKIKTTLSVETPFIYIYRNKESRATLHQDMPLITTLILSK